MAGHAGGNGKAVDLTPRLPNLLAALLVLTGAVLIAWSAYIPAKAALAQVLLERAWDRTVTQSSAHKPWPWADTWPVAKISAPRLNASAIVLHSTSGQAMAFGPGLMVDAAAIGAPGTSVIAAHRDTHFRFLKDLAIGDLVEVTTPDGTLYRYAVTATKIVHAEASGLNPALGGATGSTIALVTCYPFEAITQGPLRYVVFADLVTDT